MSTAYDVNRELRRVLVNEAAGTGEVMNRLRRGLFGWLTDVTIRCAPNRPDDADTARRRERFSYVGMVSRWPLRMTGFLRDRLRLRWLRVHRGE